MAESVNSVTESQLGIPLDERKVQPPVVSVPKLDEDGIYKAGAHAQVVEDMKNSAVTEKEKASEADGAVSFQVAAQVGVFANQWFTQIPTSEGDRQAIGALVPNLVTFFGAMVSRKLTSASTILAKRDQRRDRQRTVRKAQRREMLKKEITKAPSKTASQRVYWKPQRLAFKRGDVVPFIPFRGQTDRDAVVNAVRAA